MKVTTSLVIAAAVLCAAQQVQAIDFTPSSLGDTGASALSTEDSTAQEDLQAGSSSDVTSDLTAEKGTSSDDLTGAKWDTLSSDSSHAGDDLITDIDQDTSDATASASCSEEFSLAGSTDDDNADASDCSEELDIADSDCSEELDIAGSDCSEELDIAGSDCSEELDIAGSDCSEELDLAGSDTDEPIEDGGDVVTDTTEPSNGGGGVSGPGESKDTAEEYPDAEKSDVVETPDAEKSDAVETPDAEKSDFEETPAGKSGLGETPGETVDAGETFVKSTEPEDEVTAGKGTEGGGGLTEDADTAEPVESATKTSDEADANPFALLDSGGSAPAPAVENDTPTKPETEEPTVPSEYDENKDTSTATKGTEESFSDVEEGGADTTPTDTYHDETATKRQPPLDTGVEGSADSITPDAATSGSIPGLPIDTSTDLMTDHDTGDDDDDVGSDCSEELDIAGSDCSEELDIAGSDCSEELDIAGSDCSEELDIAGSDCSEELDIAGQDDSCSQEFSIAGSSDFDELDLGSQTSTIPGAGKGDAPDTEKYNSDSSAPSSSESNPADVLQESSDPASVPSTGIAPASGSKDSPNTAEQTAFSVKAVNFKSGDEPASTSMNLTPFIAAAVACVMLAIVGAVYMKRRSSRSKKAAGDIFTIDKNSAL